MSERTFDRETILDLTVNIVPLGIIVFFIIVFLVAEPWEFDPFIMLVSMGLLVIPFFALALLTFVSGRAIEGDEETGDRTAALSDPSDMGIESGETEERTDETADDDEVTALNEGRETETNEDRADDADETADTDDEEEHTADDAADEGDSADDEH